MMTCEIKTPIERTPGHLTKDCFNALRRELIDRLGGPTCRGCKHDFDYQELYIHHINRDGERRRREGETVITLLQMDSPETVVEPLCGHCHAMADRGTMIPDKCWNYIMDLRKMGCGWSSISRCLFDYYQISISPSALKQRVLERGG